MGSFTAIGGVKAGEKSVTAFETQDCATALAVAKFKSFAKPGGSSYVVNNRIDDDMTLRTRLRNAGVRFRTFPIRQGDAYLVPSGSLHEFMNVVPCLSVAWNIMPHPANCKVAMAMAEKSAGEAEAVLGADTDRSQSAIEHAPPDPMLERHAAHIIKRALVHRILLKRRRRRQSSIAADSTKKPAGAAAATTVAPGLMPPGGNSVPRHEAAAAKKASELKLSPAVSKCFLCVRDPRDYYMYTAPRSGFSTATKAAGVSSIAPSAGASGGGDGVAFSRPAIASNDLPSQRPAVMRAPATAGGSTSNSRPTYPPSLSVPAGVYPPVGAAAAATLHASGSTSCSSVAGSVTNSSAAAPVRNCDRVVVRAGTVTSGDFDASSGVPGASGSGGPDEVTPGGKRKVVENARGEGEGEGERVRDVLRKQIVRRANVVRKPARIGWEQLTAQALRCKADEDTCAAAGAAGVTGVSSRVNNGLETVPSAVPVQALDISVKQKYAADTGVDGHGEGRGVPVSKDGNRDRGDDVVGPASSSSSSSSSSSLSSSSSSSASGVVARRRRKRVFYDSE
ncbi:unnamed protein product, partial [Sphacelaria rigidula]